MYKVTLEKDEIFLIITALDLYSRLGIGQFGEIMDHPTFERALYEYCIPKKIPEIGDSTPQGKILDIKGNKVLINGSVSKEGKWQDVKEWKKIQDVKLSTDFTMYHSIRKEVEQVLITQRNILTGDHSIGVNGSWGIHNPKVDDTCRQAFDIIQVLRHKFWDGNSMTVDSGIHLTADKKINLTIEQI
jgi:hypothetical protein